MATYLRSISRRSFRPLIAVCTRQNVNVQQRFICQTRTTANLLNKIQQTEVSKRFMSAEPADTLQHVEDRVLYNLRCYDKIDNDKLSLHSHFLNDLGLDSLDHVEIIMAMETEFNREIPDNISETLLTPQEIIDYFADKFDIDA